MYLAQSTNWGHNLEVLLFWGEGKTGVPREKPLGARTRTNNKLNPHITPSPESNPGHIGLATPAPGVMGVSLLTPIST